MLFDDTESLYANLAKLRMRDPNDRIDAVSSMFHDYHVPEINRLFTSSPPAPDEMVSYNFERDNMKKEQYIERMRDEIRSSQSEEEQEPRTMAPLASPALKHATFESFLKPAVVPPRTVKEVGATTPPSLLSLQLREEHKQSAQSNKIASVASNRKGITVYGPNRDPIEVFINSGDTVSAVIRKALEAHEATCMEPPLHYLFPQCYDLRLHEGDGEPDEDFPALDTKRQLKQFGNMNEFCLCRNSESLPTGKRTVLSSPAPTSGVTASSAASYLASTPGGASGRDRMDTATPPLLSSRGSIMAPRDPKIVDIIMPHSSSMKLNIDETTTANDLLLILAKKPRMRMLRDEFVFCLQQADQARLQFTQPELPPDLIILPLGLERLELRKRFFADDPESRPPRPNEVGIERSDKKSESRENILYTDITAAVYQEWTVLKKNKFGRVQERIMGIDSSKIYNYETQTRNAASVRHAQRNLSSVLKVEYVPGGENRAFRIMFSEEGRESYEIEYQCSTTRNCSEIVSKLNYLLAARDSSKKKR